MRNTAEVFDAASFHNWLIRAKSGESCPYYCGLLMRDRQNTTSGRLRMRSMVGSLADAAWQANERNLVHLVQRRLGETECEYIAIKR